MKDFARKGFRPSGGERPRFGGENRDRGDRGGYRGGRGNGDERPRQMFSAVCSQCGKQCELPFRPNGEKPVYCLDCFKKQSYVPGRNSNGADGPRPYHPQPFAPQPVRTAGNDGMEAVKRQLDNLESKVNRLLDLATKMGEKGNAPAAMPAATIEKIEKVVNEMKTAKAKAGAKPKAGTKAAPAKKKK